MSRQYSDTEKPSLEEVRQRFEQWRTHRKQRTPIPESLWEGAVRLCADHSLCKVSSSLRLDYRVLKSRVCSFRPGGIPESMTSSDLKPAIPTPGIKKRTTGIAILAISGAKMLKVDGLSQNFEWIRPSARFFISKIEIQGRTPPKSPL